MPDNEWDDILVTAAEEVLETMFFTGVCGPAPARASLAEPHITARLTFKGTPSGALALSISERAARTLAANFLASEEDDPLPARQLTSVVCELANMICGSLLSRVTTEDRFRLSSPEALADVAANPPGQPNRSLLVGDGVSDGSIDLWLTLEHHAS
jgi:CheY-specific phosphatase CheX